MVSSNNVCSSAFSLWLCRITFSYKGQLLAHKLRFNPTSSKGHEKLSCCEPPLGNLIEKTSIAVWTHPIQPKASFDPYSKRLLARRFWLARFSYHTTHFVFPIDENDSVFEFQSSFVQRVTLTEEIIEHGPPNWLSTKLSKPAVY